jgi:hypothetical protein
MSEKNRGRAPGHPGFIKRQLDNPIESKAHESYFHGKADKWNQGHTFHPKEDLVIFLILVAGFFYACNGHVHH